MGSMGHKFDNLNHSGAECIWRPIILARTVSAELSCGCHMTVVMQACSVGVCSARQLPALLEAVPAEYAPQMCRDCMKWC